MLKCFEFKIGRVYSHIIVWKISVVNKYRISYTQKRNFLNPLFENAEDKESAQRG